MLSIHKFIETIDEEGDGDEISGEVPIMIEIHNDLYECDGARLRDRGGNKIIVLKLGELA
jgi:hypothetical protein